MVNVQAAGMDIGSKYKPPANYQKASSFDQLSLDSRLLEALKSAGLDSPTDIQVTWEDRAGHTGYYYYEACIPSQQLYTVGSSPGILG